MLLGARLLDIVAICGSVRPTSLNRRLLETAGEEAGPTIRFELVDDGGRLPRVDATIGTPFPQIVSELRERVASADALLLATPELNRAVSGYMKDVVDWLAILAPPRPLDQKVCAVVSASPNRFGGVFAQQQLGELLRRAGAVVVSSLDVVVEHADPNVLTSESTRAALRDLFDTMGAAVALHRSGATT